MAIGFFKESPWFRYFYMVSPFFLAIYVWCLDKICRYIFKKIIGNRFAGWGRDGAALALAENHSFAQALAISERTYATPIKHQPLFHFRTHPDHKNAGLFVKRHRTESDVVIAMDFISAAYAGSVNYLLRTDPQTTHHIHLGTPFIQNLSMLHDILNRNQNEGQAVWLITSSELLGTKGNMEVKLCQFEQGGMKKKERKKWCVIREFSKSYGLRRLIGV